jgi:hypothetical protein
VWVRASRATHHAAESVSDSDVLKRATAWVGNVWHTRMRVVSGICPFGLWKRYDNIGRNRTVTHSTRLTSVG